MQNDNKEERKEDKNAFLKGISTVVGAVLVNLIVGSIFSLCTLAVYEISYIKRKNVDSFITIDHLSFYYPFEVIFQCLSSFISGIIEKKVGLHLTNLIGFTILGIGYFTMYLSENFYIDILAMILGGIGTGIIYYPSTKNACLWFMDHNGLVIGIIETTISLGSFLFALIGENIINYDGIESESDYLYNLQIGEKIKTYLIIQIICIIAVFLVSFLLMFVKEEKKDIISNINTMNEISLDNKKLEKELISNDNDTNDSNTQKDYKKMFWVACKSRRLIIFAILSILRALGPAMMFSLYRAIGESEDISTETLQLISSLTFIFECLSGIIVGLLSDYINLKILLLAINGIGTIILYTYCFTFGHNMAFFWSTNLESFFNGCIFPFNDCYLMKVFGTNIYIEIIGYISFLTNLFVVAMSPLSFYIETGLNDNKTAAYWILFIIFGTLSLISFILSFFINIEPFNYDERINLNYNKNKEAKTAGETKSDYTELKNTIST